MTHTITTKQNDNEKRRREEEDDKKRERIGRNDSCFFGSAGIERIGEESPASTIATDTFVLKEIAQLVKHAEKEGEIKTIMVCGM